MIANKATLSNSSALSFRSDRLVNLDTMANALSTIPEMAKNKAIWYMYGKYGNNNN